VGLCAARPIVVTLEDGLVEGGVGQRLGARLGERGAGVRVLNLGIPQRFLAHGARDEVLDEIGLTPAKVAMRVLEAVLTADGLAAEDLGHERGEEVDLPRPGA
jgi:1-deoxy-D-xylulose-5-phosphate synthase